MVCDEHYSFCLLLTWYVNFEDDDSVQCCLEISCGESNRCRNNVEENSCTEGTYQPNFRSVIVLTLPNPLTMLYRNHLFCPFTSSEKLACCVLKSALSARHMTIDSFEDGGETVAQLPPEQADYLPNVVPNYNLDDDSSNLDGPSVDELNKQNIAAHPELIDPTKPLTLENMKVTSEVSTVDAVKGLKAYKADSLYAPAAKQVWMWDSNTGSSLPEDGTHVLYNSQWKRPEIVNKWNLP